MLVVDASCLYELVSEGPLADPVRAVLASSDEAAAPEVIDVEVMGLIRRDVLTGALEEARAAIAVSEVRDWYGERFPHRPFAHRVWALRRNVRTWDAYYVALAEALSCPLVTLDRRLQRSDGPSCRFIVPGAAES